ncbi:MAG: GTPase Era, partial [Christensenellaceae bacterium]|nr:GTPase Era [Christensenellaceae bacterium]
MEEYKSGFVAIMGSPNVGKSTLMNALIGMKVAIVTEKAQTTRNKVVGVLTKKDYQIVFLDTPGLHTPRTRLGEFMVKTAYDAARDVDVTLMVIDARMGIKERDQEIVRRLNGELFLAAINKTDIVSEERVEALRRQLLDLGVAEDAILCISAKEEKGLDVLEKRLCDFLLPGPQFYPEDMVTDRPERFIAGELIREKALLNLRDEIPHGIGIDIEKVEELETITNVSAVIYCERDSHKGI